MGNFDKSMDMNEYSSLLTDVFLLKVLKCIYLKLMSKVNQKLFYLKRIYISRHNCNFYLLSYILYILLLCHFLFYNIMNWPLVYFPKWTKLKIMLLLIVFSSWTNVNHFKLVLDLGLFIEINLATLNLLIKYCNLEKKKGSSCFFIK